MFWEYDSRIGRRWNIDPVPKTSISGYEVLGNNPLMFVDPMGNDKKRVDTKNDFGGNSAWEVDEKGNAVGLGMSGARQNVTVTAKARPKSLISQSKFGQSINESAKDYPAWHAGYLQYFDRKNAGSPTSQAGDKGYYNNHVASYARWYQAEEDSRAMQAWAAAIVMGPAALIAAAESGATAFVWNRLVLSSPRNLISINTWSAVGDFTWQTINNGGDVTKNNLVSTGSSLFLGPLPAAITGNVLTFSIERPTLRVADNISVKNIAINTVTNYFGGRYGRYTNFAMRNLPGVNQGLQTAGYNLFNGISTAASIITDPSENK